MPNFAIMRAKKLKGMGSVASSLAHCFRERETPNADQDRTADNEHLHIDDQRVDNTDTAMGRLRSRLPEKRRKDAVLGVEYVMTASPGWWETASKEQQRAFFRESVGWLADKYGAENIVAATVHNDELTPHLSAFVVPRTSDGRLSAKEFIGNRTKMSQDQTSYAERVAHLGLERGIEGSRAKHQRVKAHYAAIQESRDQVPVIGADELKPRKVEGQSVAQKVFGAQETREGVAQRLTFKIRDSMASTVEKASTSAQERRRREDLQETLAQQQKRLQALQKPFQGLSKDQMRSLIQQAEGMRQQRRQERQQQREARQRPGRGIER